VEEGQVRRISAYNSTSSVDITPNWDATPAGAEAAEMDQEFIHLFECAKQLHTELHSLEDASYPTGGVGTTSDKIIRRGTFGIEKGGSKPWIFRSCMINSMTISVVAGEAMKLTFEMIPFDLDRDSATNTASTGWDWTHDSPLFQDNEVILFADASYFRIDSLANAPLAAADNKSISEFELTINNNLKVDDQDTLATPYRIEPVRSGMREITGRIKVPRYEDDTYVDWMDADTELIANIKFAGSTIATVARYFEIWLPSIKITSRSLPVGGADALSQDFNFRCFAPAAAVTGFPTVYQTAPYSEAIIRILNQNPFNLFRDQNKGY